MDTLVGTSRRIDRLRRQGEAAARRRAAEIWDEWFVSNLSLEAYADAVNDAIDLVEAGPAPAAFKAGYEAAAQQCIENTIAHAGDLFEAVAS